MASIGPVASEEKIVRNVNLSDLGQRLDNDLDAASQIPIKNMQEV